MSKAASNGFDRLAQRVRSGVDWVTETLVRPSAPTQSSWQRAIRWAWMGGAYLLVLVVWGFFLRWGSIPFGVLDWFQEWQFDTILQQALRQGILPLHTSAIVDGTLRFLATPQTILSPQTLLLRFISIEAFLTVQTILLLTVGFAGCLALMKHLRLSPLAGALLYSLVGLNGTLITHVAVGQVMWLGMLVLPLFFYQLLRLIDGRAGARWRLAMAFTLFFLILQGSILLYIWCLTFLGLVWLVEPQHRRALFEAALLSGILGAFRLIPTAVAFAEPRGNFFPGYPSLAHMMLALASLLPPSWKLWVSVSAHWWEFDAYLGLLGAAYVAWFGIVEPLRRRDWNRRAIYVAAGVMALFALGYLYLPLTFIPFPFLSYQRVPSRLLALPLVAMIILAGDGFQQRLDRSRPGGEARLVMLVLLLVLGQDLVQHARLWRLELVARAFPMEALDPGLHIANRPDPAYTSALLVSVLISLAAIGYGLIRIWRDRGGRRQTRAADPSDGSGPAPPTRGASSG